MAHYYDEILSRPSSFNFATDVVDYWATSREADLAMHWLSSDMKSERKLTFQHFSQQSHRIATLLRNNLGLSVGDRLLIIIPRVPLWWEIATACIRCGVVVCPATTLLVAKDIEYRANRSGATVFVGDAVSVGKLMMVREKCPGIKHVLQIDGEPGQGVRSLLDMLEKVPEDARFTGPKPDVKSISMIYL